MSVIERMVVHAQSPRSKSPDKNPPDKIPWSKPQFKIPPVHPLIKISRDKIPPVQTPGQNTPRQSHLRLMNRVKNG